MTMTKTEMVVLGILIIVVLFWIFFGSADSDWLNKPIKDMTIKDVLIFKFLFD